MPRSVRNGKVVTGRSLALLLSCASLCILTGPLYAADLEADPSNYRGALARLRPGDTLVLKAGTYWWRVTAVSTKSEVTGRASSPRKVVVDLTPPKLKAGQPRWK